MNMRWLQGFGIIMAVYCIITATIVGKSWLAATIEATVVAAISMTVDQILRNRKGI